MPWGGWTLSDRRYTGLLLLSLIALFCFFSRTRTVEASVEVTTIEWLVDEPEHKEAKVYVSAYGESYTLVLSADIAAVDSETVIDITAEFNPDGPTSSVQISVPDQLYDAPYTTGSVPAIHIQFPPLFASALKPILAIVLVLGIFAFFEALLIVIAHPLILLFGTEFFIWASLPWVFLTILSRDQNKDGSVDFFVPYDLTVRGMLPSKYIIATGSSWWRIDKVTKSFLFFTVTYYTATWLSPRIVPPEMPENEPPWAWFEWSPLKPLPGETVVFTSISYDPDGDAVEHHWFFGDGSEAYGRSVSHSYLHTGTFEVRLIVTDDSLPPASSEVSTTIMDMPFFVVPEMPYGTLMAVSVMLLAMVVKRRFSKNTCAVPEETS